ncbi:TatD family hydrolase [Patescibacteria group bacterium]
MYIDTHCHLNFKVFDNDYKKVIKRAFEAGVEKIIVPGTDLESSKRAIEIAEEFEGVYATVGFHPHHVKGLNKIDEKIVNELRSLAKNKNVVGIGECGLDYYVYQKTKYPSTTLRINKKSKNLQKRLFGMQIQLAKELDLALVIHNREADEDVLDTIDHFCKSASTSRDRADNKYPKGVLHCVSGSREYVKKALEMGFYVGVDGNVTYDKKVEELAKEIPLDRVLLETDSPFLLPEPIRSERRRKSASNTSRDKLRNEPISVKIVAEFIARLKNTSFRQVEKETTENAERLFAI